MKFKTVSFSQYVHRALFPLRWTLSVSVSLVIAIAFAVHALFIRAQSDQQMIGAFTPFLATLVESSDRPEILRVLESIAESRASRVFLVIDDRVFASTGGIADMDQPYVAPPYLFSLWGSQVSTDSIVNTAEIRNQNEPSGKSRIVMLSPLNPVVIDAIFLFGGLFLGSLFVSYLWAWRMRRAIGKALAPLSQLHEEIRSLTGESFRSPTTIQVRELEEIRRALWKARIDLDNTTDRLAEERAKKMSADAYKGLIHDLHNPVAAMKQMIRVAFGVESDESGKAEALESLPRIADQIVNQVSAGRRNLENQIQTLRERDLRSCVEDSVALVNNARENPGEKQIEVSLPGQPVIAAHDPVLLQRALVNLIENGLVACKRIVRVSISSLPRYPSILVSDDGDGIEEHLIPIFLQGRGRSTKSDRAAMGLASVNHIVRSHGGKVIYKPSDLGGAGFEIRLEGTL